jgi:RNA polymerase sigma-70 factor, ECF subfamily
MAVAINSISDDALQKLVQNRERFLGFVQKRVADPLEAEDIVQSAFTRGIENSGALEAEESVIAWFYRILRNAIIDHYRRTAVRTRATDQYANELKILDQTFAFDPSTRNEICQCIWPLLNRLKPEYRDALQLIDLEEHPVSHLAQTGNISENNANVRLHRARRALRKEIEITCGACATHGCLDCRCRTTP